MRARAHEAQAIHIMGTWAIAGLVVTQRCIDLAVAEKAELIEADAALTRREKALARARASVAPREAKVASEASPSDLSNRMDVMLERKANPVKERARADTVVSCFLA